MAPPLRLGIAGLGTVGTGLIRLLDAHAERFRATLGRDITVTAVSARNRHKDRGISIDRFRWVDNPVELAADPGIDVFVELIGGENGIAAEAVEAALRAGKHVVTANKALLARHGVRLARLAEERGIALNFEAAVAGGIPVIKTIREALLGNEISRVYGILNGTCNYILTTMQEEGRPFAEVLKEAQERVQQLNEALAKLQVQLAQEKELEAKARQAEVSRGSWAFGPCSCFSCSQIGGLIVVGPFSLWQSVFRTFC